MRNSPIREPRPAARVTAPEAPSLKTLTSLLVGVVIVAGLYLGREVLVPITIAILLSFLVAPLVNLLRRVRFGQVPSVLVSVFLSLAVVLVLGGLIGTQVAGLASDVPHYQATIQRKVDTIQGTLGGKVGNFIDRATHAFQRTNLGNLGVQKPADAPTTVSTLPRNAAARAADDDKSSPPPAVPVEVREPPLSPFNLVMRILAPVLAPLETTGIVFIVAIFILLEREELRDRLIRLFGS
ncbi:MAG: AI-2E family transporter, partial [Janthinobacterium lividum]